MGGPQLKQGRIPRELILRNPSLSDGLYQDDFTRNLNKAYPVLEILGSRMEGIQRHSGDLWHFIDSGHDEADDLLAQTLSESVSQNIWVPLVIGHKDPVNYIQLLRDMGHGIFERHYESNREQGLSYLVSNQLFILAPYRLLKPHQEFVIGIPSQELIDGWREQSRVATEILFS